ncbi:TonB-dependent receptor [Pedobacter ginsengisoli]|nr:TonB-dependent receptor [Pedobacter ginsengisoli]
MLLLTIMLQVNAIARAQKISIREKNATFKKVVEDLRKISRYEFFYVATHLKNTQPVNLDLKNVTLEEALVHLFKDQPLTYEIKGNMVVIKKTGENNNAMDQPVQKLASVSGQIKDESGTPIPGVIIKIKGSDRAIQSDSEGRFTLDVSENEVIVFSHVSYQVQELVFKGQKSIEIKMTGLSKELSEVVVIGYGAIKQKNVTGAIAKIDAKDLNTSVASNFQQTLQGKAAGVQVIQSTGQPGAGVSVQIRSNPSFANAGVLYVIDGVPVNDNSGQPELGGGVGSKYGSGGVDKSPLNFINPNDIESIQFLKDASAASIYGARAGAGVVLVTTKKGSDGKSTLQYSGNYGVQRVDKMYPVYGAKDYMEQRNMLREEKWYRANKIAPFYGTVDKSTVSPYQPLYTQQEIDNVADGESATDAITRAGYTQQHNLSLSGGNNKTRYFASGNYFDQKGVLLGTDYKRYNGRLNIDHSLSEKINIGANVVVSNSLANNTITNGTLENGGIVTAAIYWAPNIPLRDEKGGYPLSPYYPNIPNPLSYETVTDLTKANRLLTTAYGEWKIVDGLKAKANFSYDQSNSKRSNYFPRTFLYGLQSNGSASITQSESQSKLYEYTLNYDKSIAEKHHLNAVAGYTYQQSNWEGFNAGNQNFLSDATVYYDLKSGQALKPTVGSSKSQTTWASYFARAIYTYNGNITLQASVRRDGSSIFAENKKWGYFPAVSAGWVLSDESWMNSVKSISFLKFRAGYGETGNSSFQSAAFALYNSSLSGYFGTNNISSGLVLSRAANPNLTWETAGEFNAGLDFALFNNRVSGSVDYYNKTIRNLIAFVPYPSGFIISGVYGNAGKTRSTGYEFSLESKNIRPASADGFSWSTNLNFSHYLNYWVERSSAALKVLPKHEIATGKGAIFNPVFGYISDGMFTGNFGSAPSHMPNMLPGGLIIKDIHGFDANGNVVGPDGKLTDADKTYLGNGDPKFNFGIGNTFKYKGFDLNIYLSGARQKKYSPIGDGRATERGMDAFGFNGMPTEQQRWTAMNTAGTLPTALNDATYNTYQNSSTYWYVDASYLRARNITLGYSIPSGFLANQKIFSTVRVSFDAQNLFTITKYPGLDPELNGNNFYPLVKSYVFGINASF